MVPHSVHSADSSEPVHLAVVMRSRLQKHGSFEDFMIHTVERAYARGWRVSFICPAVENLAMKQSIEAAGATVIEIKGNWDTASASMYLARTLHRLRPQLVNFHFCTTFWLMLSYLACQLVGARVVWHYHGEIRPISTLRWRNRHLSVLRLSSLLFTRIVAVSKANKRFLEALNITKPIEVIYNGIVSARFTLSAAAEERRKHDELRLIYVGSLTPRKQVHQLLRALALLKSEHPAVRLTIIGGGPERKKLEHLAVELGVAEQVIFTGLLEEYPLDQVAGSDIFVSASEAESFGLSFVEAMSLGIPVVACAVGGVPEVVADGQTGLLVAPYSPGELAAAVERLADDGALREQMGAAGRARTLANFELADKVTEFLDLLDRVLAGRQVASSSALDAAGTADFKGLKRSRDEQ